MRSPQQLWASALLAITLISFVALPALQAGEGVENIEDIEELDLGSLLAAPIVAAASKRLQSMHESPASITVIDMAAIAAMGTSQIPEVLARVAGLDLMQTNSTAFNIGMRGLNPLLNNRVLVQLDGRGVDEPALGAIQWGALPIHVGDIEKIEVVRGPGSTLYGANALSGVVAIRSKRPLNHPGVEAEASTTLQFLPSSAIDPALESSQESGGQGYAAYGWVDDDAELGVRASLTFNKRPEWEGFDGDTFHFDHRPQHGDVAYGARLALDYLPADDMVVEADVSHAFAETGVAMPAAIIGTSLATEEQALRLSLSQRRLLGDTLDLSAQADGRRVSLRSVQADVDTNILTGHGVVQTDIRSFDEASIFTVGGEVSYARAENLFHVDASRVYYAGVLQNETRLLDDRTLLINLGLRLEQANSQGEGDIEVIYRNLNPRAAVVWNFAEEHDVRVSYASAYRTPSFLEGLTGTSNEGLYPDDVPRVVSISANSALRPEQLQTVEVGYRGRPLPTLRAEAVVFGQQLTGLIGLRRTRALPLLFDNLEDWRQVGTELALDFAPNRSLTGYVHYTFVHTEDADTGATIADAPPHIFGFGMDLLFDNDWSLHTDAHVSVGGEPIVYETRPDDIAAFQRVTPPKTIVNIKLAKSVFDDAAEVYLGGRNLLAFFMEDDSMRQYPIGVHRIGATIMLGLSVKTEEALP